MLDSNLNGESLWQEDLRHNAINIPRIPATRQAFLDRSVFAGRSWKSQGLAPQDPKRHKTKGRSAVHSVALPCLRQLAIEVPQTIMSRGVISGQARNRAGISALDRQTPERWHREVARNRRPTRFGSLWVGMFNRWAVFAT